MPVSEKKNRLADTIRSIQSRSRLVQYHAVTASLPNKKGNNIILIIIIIHNSF